MSYQYCCCGCYCCRPKQRPTEQDPGLNMAGNEEDNSSAGNPGATGTTSADPDPDAGGMFDFRPPFLDDKNDGGLPSHLGPVKQLHSATGYNLAIDPTGKVYGTREPYSEEAVLEVSSHAPGEVRIKGKSAQMYVAMNERGRIYAEADPESPNTVFIEKYEDGWNYYVSKVHEDKVWFLGIKKSGKPKKGDKTRHGQKAVKFIPRPAYPRSQ